MAASLSNTLKIPGVGSVSIFTKRTQTGKTTHDFTQKKLSTHNVGRKAVDNSPNLMIKK